MLATLEPFCNSAAVCSKACSRWLNVCKKYSMWYEFHAVICWEILPHMHRKSKQLIYDLGEEVQCFFVIKKQTCSKDKHQQFDVVILNVVSNSSSPSLVKDKLKDTLYLRLMCTHRAGYNLLSPTADMWNISKEMNVWTKTIFYCTSLRSHLQYKLLGLMFQKLRKWLPINLNCTVYLSLLNSSQVM